MKTNTDMERFYFSLVDSTILFLHWIKKPIDKYIWNNMTSDYMLYLREIRDNINQEIIKIKKEKETSMLEFKKIDEELA